MCAVLDHRAAVREIITRAKVCVLGQTLVEKLFQTTNPIGKTVRIGKIPFEVVGVLEPDGDFMLISLAAGKPLVNERLEPETSLAAATTCWAFVPEPA